MGGMPFRNDLSSSDSLQRIGKVHTAVVGLPCVIKQS